MKNYIQPVHGEFLKIDTAQMIEVDRLMIEEYHIELIQMMENAGRCLAILARDLLLDGDPQGKKIAILAGTGGNGGGTMVCARRLFNWGAKVEIFTTKPEEDMTPVPRHQLQILQRMGVPVHSGNELPSAGSFDLLVDGIIGYSVRGNPYGLPAEMIQWLNGRQEPTLSLDTPSGMDLTTGYIHTPTVRASATLTLAMPKQGFFNDEVKAYTGELYLGDISVPRELYTEPSLNLDMVNPFRFSDVVKL